MYKYMSPCPLKLMDGMMLQTSKLSPHMYNAPPETSHHSPTMMPVCHRSDPIPKPITIRHYHYASMYNAVSYCVLCAVSYAAAPCYS